MLQSFILLSSYSPATLPKACRIMKFVVAALILMMVSFSSAAVKTSGEHDEHRRNRLQGDGVEKAAPLFVQHRAHHTTDEKSTSQQRNTTVQLRCRAVSWCSVYVKATQCPMYVCMCV
ncbi:hypothetical protein ACFX2B_023759 [Malus domestica]